MIYIRSILFNILFYFMWSPLVCILGMPSLLMKRSHAAWVAALYQRGEYYLEKYILGLDYEVRGLEHLPPKGTPYLVAAKHQSAYETLKLYQLFGDPTIVLKKELLYLPILGWFFKKLDFIAIDRGNREQARASLVKGAERMAKDARPIVIFPQGTRVKIEETTKEKPYKGGIAKLYTATNMPVLPLAMNSGLYWSRDSFWKKPGKVIFEFLPMIQPGLSASDLMTTLENQIESVSNRLTEEGKKEIQGA